MYLQATRARSFSLALCDNVGLAHTLVVNRRGRRDSDKDPVNRLLASTFADRQLQHENNGADICSVSEIGAARPACLSYRKKRGLRVRRRVSLSLSLSLSLR